MRTIKPLALTALFAPFQHNGKVRLVLVVGAMVSLDGATIDQEQTLWKTLLETPGCRGALDELKPKVRGEALLSGFAFAPGGKPAPIVAARLAVGAIDKEVWAVGDRFWKLTGPTEAVPFEKMPLAYDRAFGGEGYPQNPTGKGFASIKNEAGEAVHPLPNLEIAGKLSTSPGSRPIPVGFAPIDPSWPQRMKKLGTYDKKWLETRYPEMAADFDPTYFNIAPEDQWIEGSWQGGEPFVLENLHAERPRIEGTVPDLQARCLVTRRGVAGSGEGALDDVVLRCDTLWFIPHQERVIMLFRGGIDVVDEEASDIVDIVAALERKGAPRPVDHYRKVRALRLDKDRGALHALRDADLLPIDVRTAKTGTASEMRALVTSENLARANMRRRGQRQLDGLRRQLEEAGLDPDQHLPRELPPEPPSPEPDELPAHVEEISKQVEAAVRDGEARRDKALADARELCKQHGIDLDQRMARDGGGPPRFRAEDELARLKDLVQQAKAMGARVPPAADQLDDPAFLDRLRQVEAGMRQAYRQTAHLAPRATALDEDEAARMRRAVEAALAAGESLAGRDLTGADLSGIDFSGRDLSGAFLEKANLSGCGFRGANVEHAVFTRADLTGADLHEARARSANFGEADLTRARLTGGIDLSEAIFIRAMLKEADLTGATLDRAQLSEVKCDGTIFAGVKAKGLILVNGDFHGVDLRKAQLSECTLIRVVLEGADLSSASLHRTALIDVSGDRACFREAKLDRLRVVKSQTGSSFAHGDFRGATMKAANLRGVDLEGADLRDADLSSADLSECNLRGAQLEGARAVEVRLIKADLTDANVARADLMDALMGGAVVRGASFEEANVFRADAARMKGDERTSFTGANVKLVRVVPDRSAHG